MRFLISLVLLMTVFIGAVDRLKAAGGLKAVDGLIAADGLKAVESKPKADKAEPEILQTGEIIDLNNYTYKLSVRTSASKAMIWTLWSEVENWKRYDTILEYSYLIDDAPFAKGSFGYVKAKGAPKTKFELISVNAPNDFIESLKLPLYSSLELRRYFEESDSGETIFTHEVAFKGRFKSLMYFLLSRTFKKELPLVMGRMKTLAEQLESEADQNPIEPNHAI